MKIHLTLQYSLLNSSFWLFLITFQFWKDYFRSFSRLAFCLFLWLMFLDSGLSSSLSNLPTTLLSAPILLFHLPSEDQIPAKVSFLLARVWCNLPTMYPDTGLYSLGTTGLKREFEGVELSGDSFWTPTLIWKEPLASSILYLSRVLLTYWVMPRWLSLCCLLVESRTPCVKEISPLL